MSRRAGAWGRVAAGLISLAVGSGLGVIVTTTPVGASSSFSDQSAGSIVAAARAAMRSAGAVTASGSGSGSLGGAAASVTESNYAGPNSGSQLIKTTSSQAAASALPSASVVLVAGALYVYADAAFWSSNNGVASAQASLLGFKWIRIPTSSALYGPVAADLTMSSLARDLFSAKSYHKSGVRTVDGTRAVKITYTNGGVDTGPVTSFVAVGGKHYPVSVTLSGITFHFTAWGKAHQVATPKGAVLLPTLVPTTTGGTAVA